MKVVLVFFAIIAVALAAEVKYTDKFDHFNVDEVLQNSRLLKGYVNCLLNKAKCTSEGEQLKTLLPDALATNCEKCTARQKEQSEKIIRFLVNERKDFWDQLAAKYDPKDEYRKKYQNEAKAKGIEV